MKNKEVAKLLGITLITSGIIMGCSSAVDTPAPMIIGGDQGVKSGEALDTPEYHPEQDLPVEVYGPAIINENVDSETMPNENTSDTDITNDLLKDMTLLYGPAVMN